MEKKRERRATPAIGQHLREKRRQLDLTLDQVAESVGLTKSFLSDIERDKTSPSVASLLALCDVLNIPIGSLFGAGQSALIRAHERESIQLGGIKVNDHLLTSSNAQRLRGIWSEMEPGGTGGEKLYSLRCDEEMVLVIAGEVVIQIEEEKHHMQAGDSLTFDPRRAHTFYNPSRDNKAVAVFVITPPPL
ncbi:MAG TPA: helix-turn-helix domain-containing protein [Dongiaceae bacterium]